MKTFGVHFEGFMARFNRGLNYRAKVTKTMLETQVVESFYRPDEARAVQTPRALLTGKVWNGVHLQWSPNSLSQEFLSQKAFVL
jgi:hypothetical protein